MVPLLLISLFYVVLDLLQTYDISIIPHPLTDLLELRIELSKFMDGFVEEDVLKYSAVLDVLESKDSNYIFIFEICSSSFLHLLHSIAKPFCSLFVCREYLNLRNLVVSACAVVNGLLCELHRILFLGAHAEHHLSSHD